MLDWVVEKIWNFVTCVPALFLEENSHAVSAFPGNGGDPGCCSCSLLAIAIWPFRGAVIRYLSMKLGALLGKK